jgi:hypothetical protein
VIDLSITKKEIDALFARVQAIAIEAEKKI